jgi:hypothetical protein
MPTLSSFLTRSACPLRQKGTQKHQQQAVTNSAPPTRPALDFENLQAVSQRTHALIPLICFPIGILLLAICIASIAWLTSHGPGLVPLQDTRVTTIIISSGTRLSMIVMMGAFARSAPASAVPTVLAGKQFQTTRLVDLCRNFMSFGQMKHTPRLTV